MRSRTANARSTDCQALAAILKFEQCTCMPTNDLTARTCVTLSWPRLVPPLAMLEASRTLRSILPSGGRRHAISHGILLCDMALCVCRFRAGSGHRDLEHQWRRALGRSRWSERPRADRGDRPCRRPDPAGGHFSGSGRGGGHGDRALALGDQRLLSAGRRHEQSLRLAGSRGHEGDAPEEREAVEVPAASTRRRWTSTSSAAGILAGRGGRRGGVVARFDRSSARGAKPSAASSRVRQS